MSRRATPAGCVSARARCGNRTRNRVGAALALHSLDGVDLIGKKRLQEGGQVSVRARTGDRDSNRRERGRQEEPIWIEIELLWLLAPRLLNQKLARSNGQLKFQNNLLVWLVYLLLCLRSASIVRRPIESISNFKFGLRPNMSPNWRAERSGWPVGLHFAAHWRARMHGASGRRKKSDGPRRRASQNGASVVLRRPDLPSSSAICNL